MQTGGHPLFISTRDTQMARNEPLKDTARVLSRYLDCLVVRTFSQQTFWMNWPGLPIFRSSTP